MKNIGHRLGASGTPLENTLAGLNNSLGLVDKRWFKYWEFDVRESSDGVLFVFHDDEIPIEGSPVKTWEVDFDTIVIAGRAIDIEIPSFVQVVEALQDSTEAVMIDVKWVQSDTCREILFSAASQNKDWKLMATPGRFLVSFPDGIQRTWSERADALGVEFVRVGRHRINLFKARSTPFRWWWASPKWLFGL